MYVVISVCLVWHVCQCDKARNMRRDMQGSSQGSQSNKEVCVDFIWPLGSRLILLCSSGLHDSNV
jgi:hypothetical protein